MFLFFPGRFRFVRVMERRDFGLVRDETRTMYQFFTSQWIPIIDLLARKTNQWFDINAAKKTLISLLEDIHFVAYPLIYSLSNVIDA